MYTPIDEPAAMKPVPQEEQRRRAAVQHLWWIFLGAASVGSLVFGSYIASFYIRSIVTMNLEAWDLVNPGMYHEDRPDSNLLFSLHLIGGSYIMIFGLLQFVPSIRRNRIAFHRWNGRVILFGCFLAAIGGMYYVCAVGSTTAPEFGQQVNIMNFLFGVSFLVCGEEIYRHAAWTKKIDQHKRWAYRLGGICFGNIYARLYLALMFIILGVDDSNPVAWNVAVTFLEFTFFLPFIFLADMVWKREQMEAPVASTVWIGLGWLLLTLFVGLLILESATFWIPFMSENQDSENTQDDGVGGN